MSQPLDWQVRETAVEGHTQSWVDIPLERGTLWLREERQNEEFYCCAVGYDVEGEPTACMGIGQIDSQGTARALAEKIAQFVVAVEDMLSRRVRA